jgi:hypothetical protein
MRTSMVPLLIEGYITVQRTAIGLGDSFFGFTRRLSRRKSWKKALAISLTNECWKTILENYEESWHFPLASFVYEKVKRNSKRAGPTEHSCHLTSVLDLSPTSLWCMVSQSSPQLVTHVWQVPRPYSHQVVEYRIDLTKGTFTLLYNITNNIYPGPQDLVRQSYMLSNRGWAKNIQKITLT